MTTLESLAHYDNYKRVVIIGYDNRIRKIFNKGEVPEEYMNMNIWNIHLREDGDLDIKLGI